jgi:hypothetical protein
MGSVARQDTNSRSGYFMVSIQTGVAWMVSFLVFLDRDAAAMPLTDIKFMRLFRRIGLACDVQGGLSLLVLNRDELDANDSGLVTGRGILGAGEVCGSCLVGSQGQGEDDWAGSVVQDLSVILAQTHDAALAVVVDVVEVFNVLCVIDVSDNVRGSSIDAESANCEYGLLPFSEQRAVVSYMLGLTRIQ